jgi:hypothetical protein
MIEARDDSLCARCSIFGGMAVYRFTPKDRSFPSFDAEHDQQLEAGQEVLIAGRPCIVSESSALNASADVPGPLAE